MNSFGRVFRVSIFGESHGESVGVNIDGCPAGLELEVDDFMEDIERRKGGKQKGTTPRQEDDIPIFKSGIFNNRTTGAPITILFENKNTRPVIMISCAQYLVPAMQTGLHIKNMGALKTIVEVVISVEGYLISCSSRCNCKNNY
jgi:chorismate synthase